MIRSAVRADVPRLLAIYAPYIQKTCITFEYEVPSLKEFTARFDRITAKYPWIVWEEDGKILGYAYASLPFTRAAYAWCAEPTIYLKSQARGKGIGKALYDALEAILDAQGYYLLYSLVCGENENSMRFHEKRGYRTVAHFPACGFKFGRWLDLNWMEKRLKGVDPPGGVPVPWQAVMQNAEFIHQYLDNFSLS